MKIGLIAGKSDLPIEFAKSAKSQSKDLTIFALKSITDKQIEKYAKTYWINFGEAQKLIDLMHEEKITHFVMLGKIEHYLLIFSFFKLDKRAKEFLSKLKDKKAKTILEGVIKELEKEGFKALDPTPYLESLLLEKGLVNNVSLQEKYKKDVEFGIKIAKQIAQLDIGQTVVVKDQIVIAVEGIEGTDKCIERAGKLGGEGLVVCKSARKNQDMRYDVPVVGGKTLESMKKAKAKVLAVEAGKTYLINKEDLIKKADKLGISVIGINTEEDEPVI